MLLIVLGCSGSAPGPDSPASGYLLEAEGFLLGLELGNGTLSALQRVRDPFTLDALMFSHLHPDHCADFSALTVLRRYHPEPTRDTRANRLPVYAPGEAPSRFVAAYCPDDADRRAEDLSDVYDFHTLSPQTVHIGPFEVTAARATHPCESFSFRISHGGRSLAFTGDTGMTSGLVELASEVDVLLSEASWTHGEDRPPDMHLSGVEAGQLAKRCGAGRLLVTHVPPWNRADEILAEARSECPAETVLVQQGASYRI